ncbi:MAG TPA: response regulator transcription factor [Chthoniobacter sp.]|jgi:DNA-binding NarL/FixJ family response regulator
MNTEIRILLADDHEVVRRGLRTLIEMHADWKVCAEAADGRKAVLLAEELQPDLIILDLSMPELNGLEAARRIVAANPRSRVLMLTMHETEQFIRESFAAGARGYILKTDAGRDLIAGVEALLRGEIFFTSRLAGIIYATEFEGISRKRRPRSQTQLTPREREILQLLVEGRRNRDVGRVLNISVKTAETHRARIMSKLGLESVAELVRYAIRNGLISP